MAGEGEEPEHRQYQKHLVVCLRDVTHHGHDRERRQVHERKRAAPADPFSQRTKTQEAQSSSCGLHNTERKLRPLCGELRRHTVAQQERQREILPRDCDTPERAEAHRGQQQTEDCRLRPTRNAEQFRKTAEPLTGVTGAPPSVRLVDAAAHPEHQQRRQYADDVGVPPSAANRQTRRRGQPRTEDAGCVKDP